MKKTATIAFASLLALSPVAGVAYAQETMEVPADTMATGSISADQVQVIYLSALQADDSKQSEFSLLQNKVNDPAALEKAQADISANPGLAEALTAKNVQLQNVIDVQTAGDGGKIVYVK